MEHNVALIVVGPDGADVVPGDRRVKPVAEEFKIGIRWPKDHPWSVVTVGDFVRVGNGSKVEIEAPLEFHEKDGDVVQSVRFKSIETRTDFCNYKVTLNAAKKKSLEQTFVVELLSIYGASPGPARPMRRGKTK